MLTKKCKTALLEIVIILTVVPAFFALAAWCVLSS
jgi:hypothetical protein